MCVLSVRYWRHQEADGVETFNFYRDDIYTGGFGLRAYSKTYGTVEPEKWLTLKTHTQGRGRLRSRIDVVPCGDPIAFQPLSCLEEEADLLLEPLDYTPGQGEYN